MKLEIAQLSLLVIDYDEAIAFFRDKMLFELLEDTRMGETKRWVRMRPQGAEGCGLLLAKAVGEEQLNHVGNQTGGRVFFFLHTSDFDAYYAHLKREGVAIAREASVEDFGKVAVVKDLYGNLWDVIEPTS